MMEISEDASEPGSPSKRSTDASAEVSKEEVCLTSTPFAIRANRPDLGTADGLTDRNRSDLRLRKEETDIHHADNMDTHYDRGILHCNVLWPYIHNRRRHRLTDHLL